MRCLSTGSRSESLVLRMGEPVLPDEDRTLKGIDLDQVPDDTLSDPDGTMGIDSQAASLDSALQSVFETSLAMAMGNNEFRLDVVYDENEVALCQVGVSLDADEPVPATSTGVSWRTGGDLGDRPVEIELRDVATEAMFRDIGVRLEVDEAGVQDAIIGGWITVDELHTAVTASFSGDEREDYSMVARMVLESAVDIELPGESPGLSFAFLTTF